MMLLDGLPTAISVNGKTYAINADYQTCLRIIIAFEDNELTIIEKHVVLVELLYKEEPDNFSEAVRQGIRFLDCGDDTESVRSGDATRKYSFVHDDKYIFSAVDKSLNGRLSQGNFIHWWEFVLAFMEMDENCMMSRLIYLRSQKAKGKLTKEEKELYYSLKEIVDLPEVFEVEETIVINEFMKKLNVENN